jgi:hypothetical protein
MTGQTVDALDVPIEEANERWSEYKLEDGTVLRAKMTLVSVARIPGAFDAQGNPMYVTNGAPTLAVIDTPEHLRKKT